MHFSKNLYMVELSPLTFIFIVEGKLRTMKFWRWLILLMMVTALLSGTMIPLANAQDTGMSEMTLADEFYVELNNGLITEGALPLGRSAELDQVAQVIADELGESGTYSSVPPVLADEFGYPRWSDNSQRVISEPYQFIGTETPFEVATFLKSSIATVIKRDFFREVGIATGEYVAVPGGTIQNVYVAVVGAQPNVLPLIIGDGASMVYTADVELYIHGETSLAYETDDETLQRILNVRFADTQSDLADADWLNFDENSYAVPWTLSGEFGAKEIWAEVQDEKGLTMHFAATVDYQDAEMAPTPTPSVADLPITLVMTYSDDTFTLQIETERDEVRLQEIYFTWLDDLRAYEIENADNLATVDLEDFAADACIQVRVRTNPTVVDVPNCSVIYLEANEFTELDQVFWNPEFGEFIVYDGPRELGTCSASDNQCEVDLR